MEDRGGRTRKEVDWRRKEEERKKGGRNESRRNREVEVAGAKKDYFQYR